MLKQARTPALTEPKARARARARAVGHYQGQGQTKASVRKQWNFVEILPISWLRGCRISTKFHRFPCTGFGLALAQALTRAMPLALALAQALALALALALAPASKRGSVVKFRGGLAMVSILVPSSWATRHKVLS